MFGLTIDQLNSGFILDHDYFLEDQSSAISGFKYSKKFDVNVEYQKYNNGNGEANNELGPLKDYYLNLFITAGYNANQNTSNKSVIEFKINEGYNSFPLQNFVDTLTTAQDLYQLNLSRHQDPNQSTIYTIKDSSGITVVCDVQKS